MYSTVYYHKTVRAAEMMAQAAVERQPGYPEVARAQFRWTDGELLVPARGRRGSERRARAGDLPSVGSTSGRSDGGYWTRVPRERWRRLAHRPVARRALEDEIAARLRAPPGSVLIDLAGVEVRGDPAEDWADVGLLAGRIVTYPFRGSGPWHALVNRPPADWPVGVYVAPRFRAAATRLLERDPPVVP